MILFDQYSTENQVVLYVNSPQEITAYGMSADDVISVQIALIGAMEPNFVAVGCSLIDNTNQPYPIEAVAPYVVCGCPVRAKQKSPRFVIKRPGAYIITYTGSGFGDVVVESKNATAEAIEQFEDACESLCDECEETSWAATGETRCKAGNIEEREQSNCGNVRWVVIGVETWVATGDTRCNNFLIETEEVNDCGKSRWTPTTTACGFCASYPVPRDRCDGQSAYAFQAGDVKDPLATVEIKDCDGAPSVWLYPTAGAGHSVPVTDCEGNVLGYGSNVSSCVQGETQFVDIGSLPCIDICSIPDVVIAELPPLKIEELPCIDICSIPDLVIAELPVVEIKKHVVDTQVVCGDLWYIWSDGTKTVETLPVCPVPVVYCPSLRISCDGQPGFGFHEMDPKDPAATVEMAPCTGDTSVDNLWIYPSAGPGHTIKVMDCDGTLIGYAVNKSDCAPDCGCPETVINVTNKFTPVTNVAAPEVNITQAAPNVVAHTLSTDGVLTSTLSDGSTVVSNPLPSC